ncbi:unnamed protein product [Bubo scandiacus]
MSLPLLPSLSKALQEKRSKTAHSFQTTVRCSEACKTAGLESSDPSARWREEKARDYFYKSNTKSETPFLLKTLLAYNMLPSKIQPPESRVEVLDDPASQCFTRGIYNPEPEISQVVGGFWDRFQTRSFTSQHRPVDL